MSFGKSFPNLVTAASYDPFFLYITLDSVSSVEYQALDFSTINDDNYQVLALIWHELAHWVDHVATLWGQKNLVLLLNAMNAWANANEHEFYRIKTYDLSSRADDFAEYYSETYMDHQGGYRDLWKYDHTCGVRFNPDGYPLYDKPLLFTKFATSKGERISRVPVSVASILETNAIYAEYIIKAGHVAGVTDIVDRAIKRRELSEELERLLYNSDLTLYSVVAHMTATPNHINDIFKTYDISSSLGTLLLNLPTELISKMRHVPIGSGDWDQRAKAMVANGDIGFAFYNIMKNLIEQYGRDSFSLANVLATSDLPQQEDLELQVLEAMHMNLHELTTGPFARYGTLLINIGIEMYTKRGLDGKKKSFAEWFKEERFFPDFQFNDTFPDTSGVDLNDTLQKIGSTADVTFVERFALFEYYEAKMRDFINICGV